MAASGVHFCNCAEKIVEKNIGDSPEKAWDWVILSGTLLAILPFLVANAVIIVHRKRRYFQASGWELILGSSVAGLIWIASALVVNQHFNRDRIAFFGYCALWTFWFQVTLGMCGWLAFVSLRLHFIYIVVCTRRKPNPWTIWGVYLPLMLAPGIVFSIVATVELVSKHPCVPIGFIEGTELCTQCMQRCIVSSTAWRFITFLVLPPVYFSFIIFTLIRVRKQTDFLLRTQCQQTTESAMMAFVLYLLTGTTYWTNRQNYVEGRCFLTFCVCSLVFIRFWVHTGWPVYLCLFRRGDAMDKYEEELRRHGAVCLKRAHYISATGCDMSSEAEVMSESFTFDGQEAIVSAIAEIQAETHDLKLKRDSLHRRINQLKAQMEEFKKPPAVPYSQSFVTGREIEKGLPDTAVQLVTRHLSLELRPHSTWSPGSHM
ncbi:hypothetical protein MPTK1_6g08470 [Marchantia polymorpha subsp. ruderalis]|uniref:G-protein coupled receptors family 2 profile 2 domain-containing protein n=2 Tax=Marchantia polymorpha TaxID=3197 RepID=A0AAF6BPW9_MARPO|nr:hypothetical protein MARPO_0060s0074 [Marchantia polymorpha]BBN14053.1 hypothetical protein Mp_6g08470 [Marchantia polymorpha subsp. ruderalis]|eukprot:PTQ36992.1 hypothetical protein MARPO_0060s0074 [Marchantia polymorpha]